MSMPLIDYGRLGRRLDFPVLDIHAHVGSFAPFLSASLDSQVEEMDRLGVALQMVSSVEGIYGDLAWGNDQCAAAAARYPGRIFAYCHVSGQYPELMAGELERCLRNPVFRGIKLYQVGTRFDNPVFDPVWAAAEERKLPVLAHTWGGEVTGLDKAAQKHPAVNVLAGHAGSGFVYKPYVDMSRAVPNFYLDLTYSREHTNMIEYFVEQAGADKIVWGSDAPTFSLSQQVGKMLFARIPDEAKRQIMEGNARRLFGF